MELIKFNKQTYPKFQSEGNASQFAIPFAKHFCKGQGLDIGCGKLEWCFPGAIPVDPTLNQFDALNLPPGFWDYIYSSHCLEHLQDWVIVLNLWTIMLKPGGVLFLYLPDFSQHYWRPWNNTKHKLVLSPEIIKEYMKDKGYENIFISGVDLNNSFMIVGHKFKE